MPFEGTSSTAGKLPVSVSFTTASGKPATVDGALVLTVMSGDGTVTQDPGTPLEFFAVTGETATDTVIDMAADADLGAGVETIHDTFTLHAVSEKAAAFGVTVGAEVPK